MKVNDWLAALVAALALAGCATADKAPVGASAAVAGAQGAVRQSPSAYRLVSPIEKNRGDGHLFYLIRTGEQWNVSFDADEFKRSAGERLMYWPEGKKIAFVYDQIDKNSGGGVCIDAERNRQQRGYTSCTSAFRIKEITGAAIGARVFVGVVTGGASELLIAGRGAEYGRIDGDAALAVVDRLGIDRHFWLQEYRQRASAGTLTGLNDFVRRYERDDPDNLLPKVKEKLAVLVSNAKILAQAELTTPAPGILKQRYLPANPQKYCAALKADADDFKYCQSEASRIVNALADKRAAAARRLGVCQIVSTAVSKRQLPGLCEQYSTDSCRAATGPGQQVCEILNRKGQS